MAHSGTARPVASSILSAVSPRGPHCPEASERNAGAKDWHRTSLQGPRIIRFCSTFLPTIWNSRHGPFRSTSCQEGAALTLMISLLVCTFEEGP